MAVAEGSSGGCGEDGGKKELARPFGGAEWAYLAGMWHDLGKHAKCFIAKAFLYKYPDCVSGV